MDGRGRFRSQCALTGRSRPTELVSSWDKCVRSCVQMHDYDVQGCEKGGSLHSFGGSPPQMVVVLATFDMVIALIGVGNMLKR